MRAPALAGPSLHAGRLDSEADALKTHWGSATYTEARLLGDENAKEYAPIFTALRERAKFRPAS